MQCLFAAQSGDLSAGKNTVSFLTTHLEISLFFLSRAAGLYVATEAGPGQQTQPWGSACSLTRPFPRRITSQVTWATSHFFNTTLTHPGCYLKSAWVVCATRLQPVMTGHPVLAPFMMFFSPFKMCNTLLRNFQNDRFLITLNDYNEWEGKFF